MLVLRVSFAGSPWRLVWDSGVISGDPPVVKLLVKTAPGAAVMVPGLPTWEGEEILKHAGATYLLAKQIFDEVEIISGELPDLPEVPDGAIS